MRKTLLVLSLLSLAACSDRASTPTAPLPHRVSPLVSANDLPAPTVLSAVRVSALGDFDLYRVTFADTVTNEASVAIVFNGGSGYPTNAVAGTSDTGERTVEFYGNAGAESVQMNYRFDDPAYGTTCGCVYGPLSAAVAVTDDAVAATATKHHGKK